MSDTPETDAAAFDAFDGQGGDEVVFANLARRFERERNKAEAGWLECRNFAQRIVDERDRYKSEVEVITKQRDEALNKAHNYEQGYLTHAARADTLEKERDEAREALRDMLSGWKYIRSVHGDLYGVGWDRAQSKAETALEGMK